MSIISLCQPDLPAMIPLGCAKNRELANKKFTVVSAECGRESNVSSEKMNGWMALVR
jgi:hypothetical protein